MEINLKNYRTSAQAVTKICYNEPTRNLDFRIACESLEDLKKCVKIIDAYNEFEWKRVNEALDKYTSLKRYYGPGNQNNGEDLLEFDIAREGSVAMYIKFYEWNIGGAVTREENKTRKYTVKEFKEVMEKFARETKADECHFNREGGYLACRLWWD